MQTCEVCGWDTRSGARVCSACRLERREAAGGSITPGADPTGSSLLHDLLTASHERSAGGGSATGVRQRRTVDDDADADATTGELRVNGAATNRASRDAERDGSVTVEPGETADAGTSDDGAGGAGGNDATAVHDTPATDDEATEQAGVDATAEVAAIGTARTDTDVASTPEHEGAAGQDAVAEPAPDAVATAGPGTGTERGRGTIAAPTGSTTERSALEGPQSRGERLRTAFERFGAWTAVAQFALLVLGMLCVFQIAVLVVVNQFLSQAQAGGADADALAAHGKVTGVMFPALAVVAVAVAVFAGSRSDDDSGRGGVHRRVAGLPTTLWIMVAAATAVLTMGLIDASATAGQAQDVTLRAIVVCSVLGLTAFVAPRGFAAPEPTTDDGRHPPRVQDDQPFSGEARPLLAQARTDAGPEGSATADDSR